MDPIIWLILGAFLLLVSAVAYRPLKKWIKKCKRRKGGVYRVKVDHHLNRARRVNGYVGESVSFHFRKRQHLGSSNYDPAGGRRMAAPVKIPSQPWSDLNPVWTEYRFPWWLCWKWVLRPAESVVILLTWPVYNDAKNHWNPRRIPKDVAKAQRAARDAGGYAYQAKVAAFHVGRVAFQVAGAALVLVGSYGWIVTR